jgi:phosphotriesterase-related protein
VIAHAGDSNDLDYLRAIADTGAWLGCDRFGIEHFNPDEKRIETLIALIGEGY